MKQLFRLRFAFTLVALLSVPLAKAQNQYSPLNIYIEKATFNRDGIFTEVRNLQAVNGNELSCIRRHLPEVLELLRDHTNAKVDQEFLARPNRVKLSFPLLKSFTENPNGALFIESEMVSAYVSEEPYTTELNNLSIIDYRFYCRRTNSPSTGGTITSVGTSSLTTETEKLLQQNNTVPSLTTEQEH